MDIEYNGVHLELTEIVECSRDAVYDPSGTDLLYVKWRLGVVATLGSGGYPAGTAVDWANKRVAMANILPDLIAQTELADRDGIIGREKAEYEWENIKQPHGVNPQVISNQAFITDQELRYRLMTPRRRLLVTAYSPDGTKYVWLESPRPLRAEADLSTDPAIPDPSQDQQGVRVDADNGPKPLKCDIVQPTGEGNTFGVHSVIETCLPPTPTASERLVLSHRWETIHGHDSDHYLTRTIVGEVRFNGSILQQGEQQPDWFRSQFFHPIPLGFRREIPQVRLSSDGLVLAYTIVDTDPTITFDPGDSGATLMTIAENINYLNRMKWASSVAEKVKAEIGSYFSWMGGKLGVGSK